MKENKNTPHKTFVELFDIILTGNKDDSRKAAREVRKPARFSVSMQK